MIMKKGLFKGSGEVDFFEDFENTNLRKRVHKIMLTKEEKRNFMPLFKRLNPQVFYENDRKDCLMQVAKKYFETKTNIVEKHDAV